MTNAELYRSYADQERAFADAAMLASVRDIHARAAQRWMQLASLAEHPDQISRRPGGTALRPTQT